MSGWRRLAAAGMALFLLISTSAFSAVEAGAAVRDLPLVKVRPGPLHGVIVNGAGTGLDKAVIDVRDSRGDVVVAGITQGDGTFSLAALPAGEYRLTVNGEYAIALHLVASAEAQRLSLVVPNAYSAGAIGEAGGGPWISPSVALGILGVVGAGFAGAVIYDNNTENDQDCP